MLIFTHSCNTLIADGIHCTLSVFIRNKIHHPENGTMQSQDFTTEELLESTEQMIEIVKTLK